MVRLGPLWVTLSWLLFLCLQTGHALGPAHADHQDSDTEWMGIYSHGQKIGFATFKISELGTGFFIQERTALKLMVDGALREVHARFDLVTDHDLQMKSFTMRLISEPVHLEMDGRLLDRFLSLEIRSPDTTRSQEIPVDEVPWVTQNLRYFLLRRPLQPGQHLTVSLFDPLTLTCKPMEIVVEGRESYEYEGNTIPVFRLRYSWSGLVSRCWVTEQGQTLREEGFGNLSLIRESREHALERGWRQGEEVDVIRAASIPANISLPSPRELSYLKIRLWNTKLKGVTFHDHRQKTTGQDVEVFQGDLSRANDYTVPCLHAPVEGTLSPTPFIQSDDPKIRELADKLVAEHGGALESIEQITRWVHENIRKIPTISVPSAVEVLRTRRGDCNEHAALFAALARAAGIPTKVCTGIVYNEGRFCYHGWNEVYVGTWFSVDSVFGQFPADATHVKLVEGDLESQINLLWLIGRLRVQILDYR